MDAMGFFAFKDVFYCKMKGKKKMKKLIMKTVSILAVMSLSLTGCSGNTQSSSSKEEKMDYKIGITQLMEHESLDAAREGFIDGLKELGYEDGKNIKLDYKNAQGNQANCQTIAQQLVAEKNDLILAISTPSAQATANVTSEIPILVTAVTNPENAKLVKSNENPQVNVSGTSDLAPIKQQIELIKEFMPQVKKIGLLYSSSEDNSIYQIKIAKEICDELNIEYVEATVSGMNDITQVVSNLVNKVEAIYCPTDNVIASAMPNVLKITNEAKIPTFTGWTAQGDKAGMASVAPNYYELGKMTAAQAVDILKNGADIKTMAIKYQEQCEVYVNEENAKELGITIPEKYLSK